MPSLTAPEWFSRLTESRLHRPPPSLPLRPDPERDPGLGRGALLPSCIDTIEAAAMKPSSPQLDERRRERIEAALDIALAALRRIAERDAAAGSAIEAARQALARIGALLPETVQQR